MNISNKQYATSLYEAVKELKQAEVEEALKNFVQVLVKNNHLNKVNAIILEFVKLWDAGENVVEANVVSASKLNKDLVEVFEQYISKLTGSKHVKLSHSIDPTVLAGFVLRVGDQVVDGSVRTKILELKKEMSK